MCKERAKHAAEARYPIQLPPTGCNCHYDYCCLAVLAFNQGGWIYCVRSKVQTAQAQ